MIPVGGTASTPWTGAAPAAGIDPALPAGEIVTLDGEAYVRISAVDQLAPFLINLATDTDLWMFISSSGGLTAGRRDPDGAIFPYETVDKLHVSLHHTGPVTLVRTRRPGLPPLLWEPLASAAAASGTVERSLSKSTTGNRLVFEEIDHEAQLAFRARWAGSDETGWVRTCALTNLGREPVTLSVLDGMRNVLPSGAPLALYQHSSCLVDAYKRVDVDPASGLAIVSLTARISDRPEPAEALRANTVWCLGLPGARVALSLRALQDFRRGAPPRDERLLTGQRGNVFATATVTLQPGQPIEWHFAADAARSHVEIARLRARLRQPESVAAWIEDSLRAANENLRRIVGSSDGIQLTGRARDSAHHFANVLFNNLRGGVFVEHYAFPKADLLAFLESRHRGVAVRHAAFVAALPDRPTVFDLYRGAEDTGNPDVRRLCFEYLPLYFGRRHGDPSRPWNRFSITVRNQDGRQALNYEGNWRDVFQNWEALSLSFPGFLPGIIAKFVNASTVDGFNPYRITRDGVDWEVLDPRDAWSGIGYWGDHQIVYLLKLLESMRRHAPGGLENLLGQEIFSYADVPYRLKPYAEMLAHPRATIAFDRARAASIAARVAEIGQDGKLVCSADGTVYHASLIEKLIVPALSKLSSLVPGGGIWMNTERPEWNDANNALVGNGLSVVTLCYLRRYLCFLEELLAAVPEASVPVSVEVVAWLRRVAGVLGRHRGALVADRLDDGVRKQVMDDLGVAFSQYRDRVYDGGYSAKQPLGAGEVRAWCRAACEVIDRTIHASRREDGLYHAYHVLGISADGTRATIQPLEIMLEGQVAALSSGLLGATEAAELVTRLFESTLYRRDQNSFLLQPDRALPTFLERNRIPEPGAAGVALIDELLAAGNTAIVERDADGVLRFHADFSNSRDLAAALDRLEREEGWAVSTARDRRALVDLFVEVFGHRTFTGRSATMFAYEGLGCVYWHMVSKLLLAVQEVAWRAHERGEAPPARQALARHYYRIRSGLGFEKSAQVYGAFPTDPYSHTPAHAGAQQPGMTGQVKEEILTRFGELGVRVREGIVGFEPLLLKPDEFLDEPGAYRYFDIAGAPRVVHVPAGALAFSYCQVPVVYQRTRDEGWVRVTTARGVATARAGGWLGAADSEALLARRGGIERIEVGIPERILFAG